MNYAIYRCLYGEGFIQTSIKSIDPYVDKIFIFWTNKVWGDVTSVIYKGQEVIFPNKFDNVLEEIVALRNPKVVMIYNHQTNNENQFTNLINNYVLKNYPKPDMIIIPEVDHVLKRSEIEGALNYVIGNNIINASTMPIELWKTPRYRIPERTRMATIIWNMQHVNELPRTGRQANSNQLHFIPFYTHNFGFCVSEKVMYWKHLTAIAFSKLIGDDQPDPEWLDRWISWKPDYNNSALEISAGYQHFVSHAFEYDVTQLPEVIKEKYGI